MQTVEAAAQKSADDGASFIARAGVVFAQDQEIEAAAEGHGFDAAHHFAGGCARHHGHRIDAHAV